MLRVDVVKGEALFETLEPEWRALCEGDPAATPFQTPEWHSLWFKNYGGGKTPWAVCVREGSDLVGLLTLVYSNGPWRTLRSLGVGPSDYLHPLSLSIEASQEIQAFISELKGVDLIDLHQIRETQPLAHHPKAKDQSSCLVLDLPESYDAYLTGLGKSLRYDIRKLDRQFIDTRKAIVERVGSDRLDAGFECFLDMHRIRWRSRHLPGAFVGQSLRFHREWVKIASKNGWLRLRLLRVEGRIIGAIYAMAYRDTTYYYQAGFDPEMTQYSPGNVLVAQTIRESIEEGKAHFDFMRGDEPYKRRWKPQHAWSNKRILIAKGGLRSDLGLRWNELASDAEKKVRARFEGPVAKNDKR